MCSNKKNSAGIGREGVMITDSLATLCTELATLFSSLSNITRTCLGIREHLGNMELGQEGNSPQQINKTVGFNKDKNWKEHEKKDNGTKENSVGNLA